VVHAILLETGTQNLKHMRTARIAAGLMHGGLQLSLFSLRGLSLGVNGLEVVWHELAIVCSPLGCRSYSSGMNGHVGDSMCSI